MNSLHNWARNYKSSLQEERNNKEKIFKSIGFNEWMEQGIQAKYHNPIHQQIWMEALADAIIADQYTAKPAPNGGRS